MFSLAIKKQYIYSYNYDPNESDLCKLESRHIFNAEEKDKLLFSDKEVEPNCSAFIKRRLEIISFSDDYTSLLSDIQKKEIHTEGFKVKYLVFEGDKTEYSERLKILKEIGYNIKGVPDYYTPTITYAISKYSGVWYFGILLKNDFDWHKHKKKPRSYSNSITVSIAKTLVNVAAQSVKEKKLLDACCGVGTIMLEACFAGYNIEGCDINWKVCWHSRENLAFFNYEAIVHRLDIKDLDKSYDAAIIDLPYNLYSAATYNQVVHIIESTAKIANHLVIVSTLDITEIIGNVGFIISDYCDVKKIGKGDFTRKLWVCEKNG